MVRINLPEPSRLVAVRGRFDAPLLARHFPGTPPLAYFELCANEETDVGTVVEHAARLSAAGYTMDPEQLSEKTGYRLTKAPKAEPPPTAR